MLNLHKTVCVCVCAQVATHIAPDIFGATAGASSCQSYFCAVRSPFFLSSSSPHQKYIFLYSVAFSTRDIKILAATHPRLRVNREQMALYEASGQIVISQLHIYIAHGRNNFPAAAAERKKDTLSARYYTLLGLSAPPADRVFLVIIIVDVCGGGKLNYIIHPAIAASHTNASFLCSVGGSLSLDHLLMK